MNKMMSIIPRLNYKKFLLAFAMAVVSCLVYGHSASALGPMYYDDGGTDCDVSNCGDNEVRLAIGETQFVQETSTQLKAYFRTSSGQITIIDGNFCPAQSGNADYIQNNDYFSRNPSALANGTNVTKFTVGSTTKYGKKYGPSNTNCHADIVFNVSGSYEASIGLYSVTINIDPINLQGPKSNCSGNTISGCDGILNYFSIRETSGASSNYAIAQRASKRLGNSDGYDVTIEKLNGGTNYANYSIRFGADCNLASNQTAQLDYYDMDNAGGGGAQPVGEPVTMELYENGTRIDSWTPKSNNNKKESRSFTAKKNAVYIWKVNHVYKNNTIQFSTPFDGIYYLAKCSNSWALTGETNGPAKLSAPANTYMFSHLIRNTGPDKTTAYVWKVQGRAGSTGTFTDEACSGSGAINHNAAALNYPGSAGYNCNKVVPPGTTYCQRIAWQPASSTNAGWGYSREKCITPSAPTTMECLDATTDPDSVDSKTRFDVDNVGGTSSGGASTATISSIRISGPGGFNQTFSNRTVTRSGSDYKTTLSNVGPTNNPGVYTVAWTIGGENCNSTFIVADKPYLAVYGGDAITGSYEENGGCSVNRDAGFLTWNSGSPGYYGAGTQFAAMALGEIHDFASALNATTGGNPRKPTGLSFANSGPGVVDTGSGLFGGQFTDDGGGVLEDASCKFTTDVANTTSLPSTVNGTKIMYVTGSDVYIDHNIVYANSGGWGSVSTIPYFKLVVVGGDIIIKNDVGQLDGLYVAEPDGSGKGGTIYTCGNASGWIDPRTNSNFYTTCNHRLVVNGTFAAKQVRFLRTSGTLGAATSNSSNENNAAEVFHYGPEMWLPRKPGISLQYNSMSGLPPVL